MDNSDVLSKIKTFGSDAAEQEDVNYLTENFIRTEAYKKAAEANKTVIIGRKGSGKSTIFLYLERNASDNLNTRMAFVTPEDTLASKIRIFNTTDIEDQSSKILIWKFLFLVLIAQYIVGAAKQELGDEKQWPDNLRKIKRFLIDNDQTENLDTLEHLRKLAAKIRLDTVKISLAALGEIEMSRGKEEQSGHYLATQFNQLEDFLVQATGLPVFSSKRFHIYVDKVDESWKNDEPSNRMIMGLILAAYQINTRFQGVKCIVFLRTDIYQAIDFHEKDKFHGTELEILWNESSLTELVLDRLAQALKISKEVAVKEDLINKVFSGQIDRSPIIGYIMSRTFYRPRDLIQFCNKSLEVAKSHQHLTIESSDVLEAEESYSRWKLGDLVTEYKDSYPFLNDFLSIFGKRLGHTTTDFDRKYFSGRYTSFQTDLAKRHSSVVGLQTDTLLVILYNINFLGVAHDNVVTYKYSDVQNVSSLGLDKQFKVHPVFWRALGIQPSTPNKQSLPQPLKKPKNKKPEKGTEKPYTNSSKQSSSPQLFKEEGEMPAKRQKRATAKSINAAEIIVGTDEVRIKDERSGFRRIADDLELIRSELARAGVDHGKVAVIRVVACLRQSVTLLYVIEDEAHRRWDYNEMIPDFHRDRISNEIGSDPRTVKVCKLLEMATQELEQVVTQGERLDPTISYLRRSRDQVARALTDLYNLLIMEYGFDILSLSTSK